MGQVARKIPLGDGTSRTERAAIARASMLDDDPAVAGLLVGLECVGRGAVILDRDGLLIGVNGRADALLEQLAVVRDGRLQGRTRTLAQGLERIIRRALEAGGKDAVAALVVSSTLTIVVRAIPLVAGPCRFRRAGLLLVLAQTGLDLLPGADFVREAFGLTATEAEVALALAGGASASAIARERAVSPETVRSHLKTIYAKTGTKRQASLVASIMHLRDVAQIG